MNLATKKWIFLKISSAILLPLMLWFIVNFIAIYDQSYVEVLKFFNNSTTNFYLVCLLYLDIFFHL